MDGPPATDPPLRSPTSPRLRPSGPRNLTRRVVKATVPVPLALAGSLINEAAPAYPGRSDSPSTLASNAGSTSSPAAMSFEGELQPLEQPSQHVEKIYAEQGVQVAPPTTISTPSATRSNTPAIKAVVKAPTLTPPPALSFESTAIAWKGMTLETAQWTLSSEQLQEVVSKAIRKTAQESFIRLLPTKTLDEELVEELSRLDMLQATTQSQYRFNMHRRTNLLQSLLALSTSEADGTILAGLTTQLADITATCDKLMQELLRISDQRAQIQHLQDVHLTSALAMALRKLNSSYARRISELRDSRNQIEQLRSELEEAWKVAEEMAQEMDDLENFHSGFSSGSEDHDFNDESVRLAEVIGITGTAVAMKATLTQIHAGRAKEREEAKSDRSRRVSAAKKRSSQMSKASLRIPGSRKSSNSDGASIISRRSRSKSLRRRATGGDDESSVPPIPSLQTDAASTSTKQELESKVDSFLELAETRPVSPASSLTPPLPPPPIPANLVANELSASPIDLSDHSKRDTLDFDIPPINVYPAEDGSSTPHSARRVQSMLPAAGRHSLDENGLDGSTRVVSEYKKFDGWPFGGVGPHHNRRSSMPMNGPLMESNSGLGSKAPSPLRRVFSPPPQPSGSTL